MRPVPAGRQRGQCCTPYSRLQEEIDNVETIAVTANNTANNAANAANTAVNTANTAVNTANTAASDAADALAGLTDGSVTQIGTSNVGTDTKPIKLVGGVPTIVTNDLVDTATAQSIGGVKTFTSNPKGANPASGATDDSLVTANWISQTGNTAPNNVVHRTANEDIDGIKTFKNIIYRQCSGSGQSTLRINNSSGNHYLSSLYDSNNKLRHQMNTQAVITGDLATRTVFAMQTPDYDTVAQTGYHAELTLELVGTSGAYKLIMYKRAGDGTLTSTTLGTL